MIESVERREVSQKDCTTETQRTLRFMRMNYRAVEIAEAIQVR